MTLLDWPLERLWLVTADDELFTIVRCWAQGDLRDVSEAGTMEVDRTLLLTTPPPWRSVVAVAQQRGAALRPMAVLKNAVALWALGQPPEEGPLPAQSWPSLRRLFLIHNPGLGGVLDLLDHAVDARCDRPPT